MNPKENLILATPLSARLYSLDALRGFDMFWILGFEEVIHGMKEITGSAFWAGFSNQLTHPAWHGFHMYDLIFPLFIFIAGVATPYSIDKEIQKGKTKGQILQKVLKRSLILILLGVIHNNKLILQPMSEIRFASVLGRIGIAYFFSNVIYLYSKRIPQMIIFGAILIGYWLIMRFNSAPGFPTGDLTMEGNFASYVDRLFLPGKLYLGIHDPEGILSSLPSIGNAMLGILCGSFIKSGTQNGSKKSGYLAIVGTVLIALALLWNLSFPINKNLWTSSFVLLTGGISFLFFALFYFIIDVQGYKKWAFFFSIIGMNSILIYMSGQFISWGYTGKALFTIPAELVGPTLGILVVPAGIIAIKWAFLYFLYKKKIFLRV